MIQKNLEAKLNEWYKDLNGKDYALVLTDDIDSLSTCQYLQAKFPSLEVGGFFNFGALYINMERAKGKTWVFVDADITRGRCFGNHRTPIHNPLAVNPNIIAPPTYNQKYIGSTLLWVMALYDENLSALNEQALIKLLCIDGAFSGYYNQNGAFKHINQKWFNALGYPALGDFLEGHKKEDFEQCISQNKLTAKIKIKGGHLESALDVPYDYRFELLAEYKKEFLTLEQLKKIDKNKIFNAVETYNGKYVVQKREDRTPLAKKLTNEAKDDIIHA